MRLLCPNCRSPLDPAALCCIRGHRFSFDGGVLVLVEDRFGRRLRSFAAIFSAIRHAERRRILDPAAYQALPFGPAARGSLEWRLRRCDLAIVRWLLRRRERQRILDIGAWNGWLSNRLAALGHTVTAIDYFADVFDGLGARAHYNTSWHAIQMDLLDLSLLQQRYDVVVINRCLQFFADPAGYAAAAAALLAPGGLLIITGLQLFRDPAPKAREVARLRRSYLERYGFELFLRPTKGYLDLHDLRRLRRQGIALWPYPQLLPANLKALLRPALPLHLFGVKRQDN